MTKNEKIILEVIMAHDGQWNWHKLGRYVISRLGSPAELTLQPLLQRGYIEERFVGNEPLPRLHITEAGKAALRRAVD